MDAELRRALERAHPGEEARYFPPISVGSPGTRRRRSCADAERGEDADLLRVLELPRLQNPPSSARSACCWTEQVDLVASSRRHGWRSCPSGRSTKIWLKTMAKGKERRTGGKG